MDRQSHKEEDECRCLSSFFCFSDPQPYEEEDERHFSSFFSVSWTDNLTERTGVIARPAFFCFSDRQPCEAITLFITITTPTALTTQSKHGPTTSQRRGRAMPFVLLIYSFPHHHHPTHFDDEEQAVLVSRIKHQMSPHFPILVILFRHPHSTPPARRGGIRYRFVATAGIYHESFVSVAAVTFNIACRRLSYALVYSLISSAAMTRARAYPSSSFCFVFFWLAPHVYITQKI